MKKEILYPLFLFFIGIQTFCTKGSSSNLDSSENSIPEMIGERPLFKDFMGINGHFTFKPELYNQVCRLVRNYHSLSWDVANIGDDFHPPFAKNGVNWKDHVYEPWKIAGFETDICLQIETLNEGKANYSEQWKGKEEWSYNYAKSIAAYFGPSGKENLATSIEIGNEPGVKFDTLLYKKIFKNMAQGIRDGDSKIKIVTPYVSVEEASDYAQDLKGIYAEKDILPLYDVINLHSYASVHADEGAFNRSYPEDPTIDYLEIIDKTISWRDEHAPNKEIWITEFGYDASTEEAMKHRKDWALKLDWQGTTDEQQAQYLVRSYLAFAERGIQRAYLFYYNDEDEASIHASSGITRHFQPKMSFWAIKQLYQTLGDYRLKRVVEKQEGNIYVYEFEKDSNPDQLIWVAWSPTGTKTHKKDNYKPRIVETTIKGLPSSPIDVIGMTTSENSIPKPAWKSTSPLTITFDISESPTYIFFDSL